MSTASFSCSRHGAKGRGTVASLFSRPDFS